ncbi:class I SAM-dependent methyltransferase [Candidatus Woesearchaeota archaeon]|nr:class I SAM-dependent methyltransferase [Candidatus Woesearchaeota archaeon]
MDPNERKAWTEIITPEDLDDHLAEIEQAETNAHLIVEMFNDFSIESGPELLVPGCGTGQMFDYIEHTMIGDYNFTFTDLNPKYLEKLGGRLLKNGDMGYSILIDDIEDTKLSGIFDGILAVLLLQHIEWRKGINSMLGFNPSMIYLIIQEQENEDHVVTKERDLRPSIKKYAEIENPCLVPRQELTDYLRNRDYKLLKDYERQVPDQKSMIGLVFEKS